MAGVKDLTEATGESEFTPEFTRGLETEVNDLVGGLVVHKQMYQEITMVLECEERKLNERRKRAGGNSKKSTNLVQDTLKLCALKQFNDLWIKYHQKNTKKLSLKLCPSLNASTAIAKWLGKLDYYTRRLGKKLKYLHQVGELQTSKWGKGAAHWSLLSEPWFVTGIQTWVKGTIPVEKGGHIGWVRHSK